jgi:hypothetical protein
VINVVSTLSCNGHVPMVKTTDAKPTPATADVQTIVDLVLRPLRRLGESLCLWLARATKLFEWAESSECGPGVSAPDSVVHGKMLAAKAPLVAKAGDAIAQLTRWPLSLLWLLLHMLMYGVLQGLHLGD